MTGRPKDARCRPGNRARAASPVVAALLLSGAAGVLSGCPIAPTAGPQGGFRNGVDPTNGNANLVGSSACLQCHAQIADWHRLHGHSHPLTPILGAAPRFPEQADRALVPEPPEGYEWSDISWLIGGYTKQARFIDQDGFVLTTGVEGVDTQWNLAFPANGSSAGFAPFEAGQPSPLPYDFSCFQCHTTGSQRQDAERPIFQENRAGFRGTWQEAGIQCESCHGPGSNHFLASGQEVIIDTAAIFVDPSGAVTCNQCHDRRAGAGEGVIRASEGFIEPEQQYAELRASGGHAAFSCTYCHDPHRSVAYDRAGAIRNECTACHADQNMALHEGFVFSRGAYAEPLSCASCHMPFATRSASVASADVVGDFGRMADTRTHIFRIEVDEQKLTFETMFEENGAAVRKDAQGRAAVTVDFVCLRCHNGMGNAFTIRAESANEIAFRIHGAP